MPLRLPRLVTILASLVSLLAALAAGLALPPNVVAHQRWRWPLDGRVTARFAVGADPFAGGQHRGIDIAAPAGAVVRSACAGRVSFAGWAGSSGRTVSVRCGALSATYLHLAAIAVDDGDDAPLGRRLGTVGTSGGAGAPHLHFGIRRAAARFGYVDPLTLLPGHGPHRAPPLIPTGPRGRALRPRGLAPHGARGLSMRPAAPTARVAPARVGRAVGRLVAAGGAVGAATRRAPAGVRRHAPWLAWAGLALAALAVPGAGLGLVRRRVRRRRAVRAAGAGIGAA